MKCLCVQLNDNLVLIEGFERESSLIVKVQLITSTTLAQGMLKTSPNISFCLLTVVKAILFGKLESVCHNLFRIGWFCL